MTHHCVCQSFSDLFISELLIYNVGVEVERCFGSVKFAVSSACRIFRTAPAYTFCFCITCTNETQSFITVSALVATIFEFCSLLLLNNLGLSTVPASPIALVFSILYQFSRIVPSIYHFRIFGIVFNNKSFTYLLAAQVRRPPVTSGIPLYPPIIFYSVPRDLSVFIASIFSLLQSLRS